MSQFAYDGHWPLNVVPLQLQYETYGKLSDSVWVNTILMLVCVTKFFWWEAEYWNTMDIAHDRVSPILL
ncbi:7-dehydrocholesterol reductase [Salvia divinorum]|uniref:7-dehydrocholesterol reductase n=1 Tax=Salvia divinorum TaxID=28513 RepID=A0ABD1H6J9_SALDI